VVDNRKRFFDSFAAKYGFDPLQASKWYSVSSTSVMSEKVTHWLSFNCCYLFFNDLLQGGISVLAYYGKSIARALMAVYPSIGLHEAKFSHAPRMMLHISTYYLSILHIPYIN